MFDAKTKLCTCDRCGHNWTATGKEPPKSCAKCKSKGWNKPRVYAGKYAPIKLAYRYKPTGRAAAKIKTEHANKILVCESCQTANYIATRPKQFDFYADRTHQIKPCRHCRKNTTHRLEISKVKINYPEFDLGICGKCGNPADMKKKCCEQSKALKLGEINFEELTEGERKVYFLMNMKSVLDDLNIK